LAPPQQVQTWRSAAVKSIFENLFETIRVPASTPAVCPRAPAQLHKVLRQLFPQTPPGIEHPQNRPLWEVEVEQFGVSVGASTQGPRVDKEDEEREPHSRKAALAGVH